MVQLSVASFVRQPVVKLATVAILLKRYGGASLHFSVVYDFIITSLASNNHMVPSTMTLTYLVVVNVVMVVVVIVVDIGAGVGAGVSVHTLGPAVSPKMVPTWRAQLL